MNFHPALKASVIGLGLLPSVAYAADTQREKNRASVSRAADFDAHTCNLVETPGDYHWQAQQFASEGYYRGRDVNRVCGPLPRILIQRVVVKESVREPSCNAASIGAVITFFVGDCFTPAGYGGYGGGYYGGGVYYSRRGYTNPSLPPHAPHPPAVAAPINPPEPVNPPAPGHHSSLENNLFGKVSFGDFGLKTEAVANDQGVRAQFAQAVIDYSGLGGGTLGSNCNLLGQCSSETPHTPHPATPVTPHPSNPAPVTVTPDHTPHGAIPEPYYDAHQHNGHVYSGRGGWSPGGWGHMGFNWPTRPSHTATGHSSSSAHHH